MWDCLVWLIWVFSVFSVKGLMLGEFIVVSRVLKDFVHTE